ncbi:MAG: hypothetical protein ACRC33_13355, partial [Gemmataceae bacterium]
MTESVVSDLPTPAQMRAYHAAQHAAWNARRMREASRAVITGNLAGFACVAGAALAITHAGWPSGPFLACGLVYAQLALAYFSVRWVNRARADSPVTVLDRQEDAARTARPLTWRFIVPVVLFQVAVTAGWMAAFRHLSQSAILAALSVGPLLAVSFFLVRFGWFRFWEDLLFAGCVA